MSVMLADKPQAATSCRCSAGRLQPHHHLGEQSCFYLVVFPTNSTPIFHSNRIPADLIAPGASVGDTCTGGQRAGCACACACACPECAAYWRHVASDPASDSQPGAAAAPPSPVGDYILCRGLEETPQQTLQTVAFPSTFGTSALHPPATMRPRNHALEDGGGVAVAPPRAGPSFNLRLEEVRTAGGQLRFYRLILTSAFTVMVSTRSGGAHSMQTRQSAVALVISCPPSGDHCRFLLAHFDACRALLHRSLTFAMRLTERFFERLFASQARTATGGGGGGGGVGPQQQQRMMRNITYLLERDEAALEAYRAVKDELAAALALRQPLPPGAAVGPPAGSHPFLRMVPVGAAAAAAMAQAQFGTPPVTPGAPSPSLLFTALSDLLIHEESFLSAFVAGLLSLAGGQQQQQQQRGPASLSRVDPCAGFWLGLEAAAAQQGEGQGTAAAGADAGEAGATRLRRPPRGGTTTAPPRQLLSSQPAGPGPGDGTGKDAAAAACALSARARSRVIIFAADPAVAQRLVVVAAFFLGLAGTECVSRSGGGPTNGTAAGWMAAARRSYQSAVAGTVSSLAAGCSVAVQWVPRGYEEADQRALATAAESPDGEVLLADPSRPLCRALRLLKTLETTTVLVEQQSGGMASAAAGAGGATTASQGKSGDEARPATTATGPAAGGRPLRAVRPFRSRLRSQEEFRPDAAVTALLREVVSVERRSGGAVDSSRALRDAVAWLASQARARALQQALYDDGGVRLPSLMQRPQSTSALLLLLAPVSPTSSGTAGGFAASSPAPTPFRAAGK